jgi:hypothetical protein
MVCRDFWDIGTGTGPGARRLRSVRMSPKLNPNARGAPDEDEGAELAKTIVGHGGNLKGCPGIGRSAQRYIQGSSDAKRAAIEALGAIERQTQERTY